MEDNFRDYYQSLSSFRRTGIIKECFYHKKEECKGKIKQSHSVQRNGRLSIIEGEVNGNMSVYTFTSHVISEHRVLEDLKPIGKKEASTFFGFCDFHDSSLFSDIENFPFDNSDKHLFLHSYRSFAHSYHRKNEELKAYSNEDSEFVKKLPKFVVEMMLNGIQMAVQDSAGRKLQLDKLIEEAQYDELEYFVYEKGGLYPFAVSSQMSPKVSYFNKPMNNHIERNEPFSQPMITLLPDVETTFVILAAFPDDLKAVNLLNELDSLSDIKVEKAITSLIMANCENTFFAPAFWNYLNASKQRAFLDEFEANTKNMKYFNKFFHSDFNFFDNRYEAHNLGIKK